MDAAYKAAAAKLEQEQERAAYVAKMERDDSLAKPIGFRPATERQYGYIKSLIAERDITAIAERVDNDRAWAVAGQFSTGDASALIDLLLAQPRKQQGMPHDDSGNRLPDVPAGRYAVATDEGHLAFYVVQKPTEGKWAGYTFVSVMASDAEHPLRSFAAKASVLGKIAVDPGAASRAYGHEIGSCGVCGRTLTDEHSRERGIGPICAEKTGW